MTLKHALLALSLVALATTSISAQTPALQWKSDLEIVRKELPKKRPNLFQHCSQKEFNADLDALEANLNNRSNFEIALDLQVILAKFQDGNTHVELKPLLLKTNPIPFGLGQYADGLYVSGTVEKFKKALGKKVLKINDLTPEQALEKISRFVPAENKMSVYRDGLNYFRFPAAFRQAGISKTDTLVLTLAGKNNTTEIVKLYPLDMNNRKDMAPATISPEKPDLRWQQPKGLFFYEWLATDSVLYVQYNRCIGAEMAFASGDSATGIRLPMFMPFADTVMAFLQRTPYAKVFLDLRFNPGGGAGDGIMLADRIAANPEINNKDRVFVAVNTYTGGAAVQIAGYFKEKTNATLLGEYPADRPNRYGQANVLSLPGSGLQVIYGTQYISILSKDKDLLPLDVDLPLPYDDFRKGKDPLLNYVRKI